MYHGRAYLDARAHVESATFSGAFEAPGNRHSMRNSGGRRSTKMAKQRYTIKLVNAGRGTGEYDGGAKLGRWRDSG